MKTSKPTVIDLFSGAGGMSEGFKEAGFEILLGIDFVDTFVETFKKNHDGSIGICGDIREVTVQDIIEHIGDKAVDVIVGGPPCQGFSMAGRRDRKDPRNSLFMEFIRIVDGLKPTFIVMENVPGLLTMKTASEVKVVDIIKEEFEAIGYHVEMKKLLAADFGVPQKRRRIFFIGTNTQAKVKWPEQTHAKEPYMQISGDLIPQWVGVGSVLLDEKDVPPVFFHSQKMIDGFVNRKKRNIAKGNGFGWQILRLDEPSYTISARYWKDGGDALVRYSDKKVRMLTPRECARIQTFPDSYEFTGSKRLQYTQIGNAVPCLLAKAIAKAINESLAEV